MTTVRLGVFVVGTLAIFTGGVFLIGSRHLTFRSTYRLNAEFQNVAGLDDGAEVRVGGIHEGTVRHIDLPNRPDGKVTVQMDLATPTLKVVKKDSIASIQAEGLVGDKYVDVSFGSNDAGALKDGDTIASQPPLEMASLFKKTDDILNEARDAVQKIDQGTGTVGQLVNNKALYQKVTAGATAFQEDAEALKHNFLLRGFFQKRGYEDASELTKYAIPKLPSASPEKTFTFESKQIFDKPDATKLKNDKALKPVGEFMEANPFSLVVVEALSGMKGDSSKDSQLTLARAAVVRDYLVKNFRLDDSRIKTMGKGKNEGTPDDGEVDVLVYSNVAPPRQATGGH